MSTEKPKYQIKVEKRLAEYNVPKEVIQDVLRICEDYMRMEVCSDISAIHEIVEQRKVARQRKFQM